MIKKIEKGFTLIELLVVIAVIGILAGILFVAIDPKDKISGSKDASVKKSLSDIPTAATLSYMSGTPYSYTNLCSGNLDNSGISQLNGYNCNADSTSWAVEADLPSDSGDKVLCIDSKGGGVKELASSIGTGGFLWCSTV